MEIRWLGNSCLEVDSTENLLIDPSFTVKPQLDPDIILITHEHDDHIDPEQIKYWEKDVPIFAPGSVLREFDLEAERVRPGEEIAGSIQAFSIDCYGSDEALSYYYKGLLHTADAARFTQPGSAVSVLFTACFADFYQEYLESCQKIQPDLVIPYHYDHQDDNEREEARELIRLLEREGFNTRQLSPGEKIEL